jgi:hypothetical protein
LLAVQVAARPDPIIKRRAAIPPVLVAWWFAA